ncbi:MAG TPA: hypothetical protein GX497_12595 [Bacillus bacterium]|nr:hypothetical protein [Bacillus sp. (in: firmicutes)]
MSTFPHISDGNVRQQIVDQYKKQLSNVETEQQYMSAQDQYEALKKRKLNYK